MIFYKGLGIKLPTKADMLTNKETKPNGILPLLEKPDQQQYEFLLQENEVDIWRQLNHFWELRQNPCVKFKKPGFLSYKTLLNWSWVPIHSKLVFQKIS